MARAVGAKTASARFIASTSSARARSNGAIAALKAAASRKTACSWAPTKFAYWAKLRYICGSSIFSTSSARVRNSAGHGAGGCAQEQIAAEVESTTKENTQRLVDNVKEELGLLKEALDVLGKDVRQKASAEQKGALEAKVRLFLQKAGGILGDAAALLPS